MIQSVQGGANLFSVSATRAGQAAQRAGEPAPQPKAARDEYIHTQEEQTAGVYSLGRDEEGNPKIQFDPPKAKAENGAAPENKAKSCTTNTDRVDREIEQLKKEREQLVQQLRTASAGENASLQRRLEQVERELSQKDNDAYRRSHAVIS